MEYTYERTGKARKELVQAISEILGRASEYRGAPTFAYKVGECYTITADGTLEIGKEADFDETQNLIEELEKRGFEATNLTEIELTPCDGLEENTDRFAVEMPREGFTDAALENLQRLVDSKAGLIKKALNAETLPIEIRDDRIAFPWFSELHPDAIKAYTHFVSALCEMAKTQKRITAKERPTDNEKYAFRCFLLRLGFIGGEYKTERKILLGNLTGSSAFREGGKHGTQERRDSMNFPSRETLERLRKEYPTGARVELLKMSDVQAPPTGTRGTVNHIDDAGTIHINWDTGSSLGVVFGEDECRVVAE